MICISVFVGLFGLGLVTAQSTSTSTAATAVESSNFPHEIPEPLPSVTPDGVVNLFIQEMEGYAGLFEASIVNVDPSSTTYWVACATSIPEDDCPFDTTPPFIGMSVTQGPKGMQMTLSEEGWSVSQSCPFATTTTSVATCMNYWSVGNSDPDRGYYGTETTAVMGAGTSVTTTAMGSESTSGQSSGTGTITPAPVGTQSADVSRTSASAVTSQTSNSSAWKGSKINAFLVLSTFLTVTTWVYLL
ncbi:hypothetical protein IFR05_015614 [Cadophora sp. M221]|nr:hypothetical protein IFR05_015614 [Cadophora sp. M221]